MRRVALIYNPASGQHSNGYLKSVENAQAELQQAGVEAEIFPTQGPGTAGEIAQQAVGGGCDTVIACGGDGTVNEVLQTLVGGTTALGLNPFSISSLASSGVLASANSDGSAWL